MSEEEIKKEEESLEDGSEESEKGEETSEEEKSGEAEEVVEESSEDKSGNSDDKDKDSQESGAKLLVIGLVVVVIGMVVVGWVISESKKVDYIGLTFTKENFGQIPIYTTQLSGMTIKGNPLDFKLALRDNPKESEVPFVGNLKLDGERDLYLSVDMESGVYECGSDALINFGYFMGGLEYNLQTAVTSKEAAEEYDKPMVVCDNTNGATVFVLTSGEESRIVQQGSDDCYVLEVNDCELSSVMERLEIATLAYIRGEEL
tara:strand:+ start:5313 stop:6092 length:780 start_codon:yes stop_codon:yes gene_type:complete